MDTCPTGRVLLSAVDRHTDWVTILNGEVVLGPTDVGSALREMARLDRLADRKKLGFAVIGVCRAGDVKVVGGKS